MSDENKLEMEVEEDINQEDEGTDKKKGIKIYSTSLDKSISIYDNDFTEGLVLIIGNESKGVSEELFSLSDRLIRIPMPGKAESLNAGVAASIIMYEASKQRF